MTFETLLLIVFALNNSSFCASHVVALNFLLRITSTPRDCFFVLYFYRVKLPIAARVLFRSKTKKKQKCLLRTTNDQ